MKKNPLRLTISFCKNYKDVFHYLYAQENTSKYICELIRREMKNVPTEDNLEEKVYKILLHFTESEHLSLITDKTPQKPSHSQLIDEEVDLLNDLFG